MFENHAERFVSNAPQIPPTAFSFRSVPSRSPSEINTTAIGMLTASISKMFTLTSSPRKNATTTHTALCKIAIGKSGSV